MGEYCYNENNYCSGNQNSINIMQTTAELSFSDVLGSWKARWSINRMNFKVVPGLYCIGHPDSDSPVFVTANYKMSFDYLRKELNNIAAFILVLDTKGVNVWCAAAKGTFGTKELIRRIDSVNLNQMVSHNTLILPQLGSVGIAAHEVKAKTGFTVVHGPVKAGDISAFLNNGMKADKKMRPVKFGFVDRIILTPVEIVGAITPTLITLGIAFLLNLIGIAQITGTEVYTYIGATLIGCLIVPMLLPFVPVSAFTLKGWIVGLLWIFGVIAYNGWLTAANYDLLKTVEYLLIFPSVSALYALGFTGCTPYTSESGVEKETKSALPVISGTIGIGVILMLVQNFIKL